MGQPLQKPTASGNELEPASGRASGDSPRAGSPDHETIELVTVGRTERGAPVLLVLAPLSPPRPSAGASGSSAGGAVADPTHTGIPYATPDPEGIRGAISSLCATLLDRYRIIAPCAALPEVDQVERYTARLSASLEQGGVKRLTLLGTGAGASVAQALGVALPGIVRRVLLVDPTARITPSLGTRIIDRLERFLPTGLPLRSLGNQFDSRPQLHRLRCPVLILVSMRATLFEQSQARVIARRAPNARLQRMSTALLDASGRLSSELLELLEQFNLTPAKRSQKPVGNEE